MRWADRAQRSHSAPAVRRATESYRPRLSLGTELVSTERYVPLLGSGAHAGVEFAVCCVLPLAQMCVMFYAPGRDSRRGNGQ
jgi:hypothetical protein